MLRMLFGAVLLAAALPQAAQAQLAEKKVLTLEATKRVVAAAEAEAVTNGWNVTIVVVDDGGHLLFVQRMDGAHVPTMEIAQQKARSAALYRRPTKVFADWLANGGTAALSLPGAAMLEGGLPLVVDGQVLGAIGVSGVTAEQDGIIAKAGADALTALVHTADAGGRP